MTTLAAIQGDGWVVIGCDSRIVGNRTYTLPEGADKVIEDGAYLYAVCGDFRVMNILANNFDSPEIPEDAKKDATSLDRFMNVEFVPALRKCFSEQAYGKKRGTESEVMVAIDGTLYELGTDFSLLRDDETVHALGSGADVALGALTALVESGKGALTVARATRYVTLAIEIAARYDKNTAEPVRTFVQQAV